MKRDWDKLRRSDKAKRPSPIDSFKPKPMSRNARLRKLRREQAKRIKAHQLSSTQLEKSNRTEPSGQHKNPAQTEEGLKPAILKHGGTTSSLKNDTNPDQQRSSPASGLLERNGVTASSPLNCPAPTQENSEPPNAV